MRYAFKIPGKYQKFPEATGSYRREGVCSIYESFNGWGGRGYDDSVSGVVTKTAPSGDRTASYFSWSARLPRIQLVSSGGWSNMSPVGTFFVPSPPKTGTNLRHLRPPQSLICCDDKFEESEANRRVFRKFDDEKVKMVVFVHVDDSLAQAQATMERFAVELGEKFQVKSMVEKFGVKKTSWASASSGVSTLSPRG